MTKMPLNEKKNSEGTFINDVREISEFSVSYKMPCRFCIEDMENFRNSTKHEHTHKHTHTHGRCCDPQKVLRLS